MSEYAFLAALFAVAVATVVGGILLRRRLGPKIPAQGKAGRKGGNGKAARKGGNGSKDRFFQDGKEMIPHEDGDVWEDDDLYGHKDGKAQGPYKGDKAEKDDGKLESWDKY